MGSHFDARRENVLVNENRNVIEGWRRLEVATDRWCTLQGVRWVAGNDDWTAVFSRPYLFLMTAIKS